MGNVETTLGQLEVDRDKSEVREPRVKRGEETGQGEFSGVSVICS